MKVCGCGCKTELKMRKDGNYASYAPGGHDAKHKSALVKAALAGDKKAEKILVAKNWLKFLEAKQKNIKKNTKKKTAKMAVPQVANKDSSVLLYGMSEYDIRLLKYPPREDTWVCIETDDYQHGGAGDLKSRAGHQCWFCDAKPVDNSDQLWPVFQDAILKLDTVPWDDVQQDASIFPSKNDYNLIVRYQNAKKMLNLKKRYRDGTSAEI